MKTLNRLTITLKLVALLVTAAMFHVPPVLACTSVQLSASDGSVVVARTMDDNPATMKINVALTPWARQSSQQIPMAASVFLIQRSIPVLACR